MNTMVNSENTLEVRQIYAKLGYVLTQIAVFIEHNAYGGIKKTFLERSGIAYSTYKDIVRKGVRKEDYYPDFATVVKFLSGISDDYWNVLQELLLYISQGKEAFFLEKMARVVGQDMCVWIVDEQAVGPGRVGEDTLYDETRIRADVNRQRREVIQHIYEENNKVNKELRTLFGEWLERMDDIKSK